jgi:uncharacterized protein (TIGR02246 family)
MKAKPANVGADFHFPRLRKTMYIKSTLLTFVVALFTNATDAQQPTRPRAATPASKPVSDATQVDAVKKTAEAFAEAFNKHDAKAVAALWTEDGEYVDAAGQRFEGRAAIEKEYEAFFAAAPTAKITVEVDAVRSAGAAAAIEDGRTTLSVDGKSNVSLARYTAVHAKVGDHWLMSSVRDVAAVSTTAESNLHDLDWLVGSWVSEQNGGRMEVECKWLAEGRFLERRYSVTRDGKVVSSGLQIIGWNAAAQSVESWTFTADGGHAIGLWTPRRGGWVIENIGRLADGTPTTAINFFVRIDENSLSWKSVARSAGATPLADADEVVLKRVVAKQ